MPTSDDSARLKQRIRDAVRRIPRGFVATYGDIAVVAGAPGRARLVGRSLERIENEAPLPWHRVIAASGRIALPEGSPAYAEQCAQLANEGVIVNRGRIDLARYRWRRGSPAPVID